jgi:pimeloyl-ACP methyl ester carboxylesterase
MSLLANETTFAGATGGDLPVVALHSSASTGGQWKSLAAALGAPGAAGGSGRCPLIAPDLPGYGAAAADIGVDGAADLTSEAEAVLEKIGPRAEGIHLVGHSYGGAVALRIALTHPNLVRSLTLIEPVVFHLLLRGSGSGNEALKHYREIIGLRDRLRGALAAGWPAYGMAAFVDFWNGAGTWWNAEAGQRQRLAAQASAVLRNFTLVLAETWTAGDIAGLPMPLLTVTGSESPAVSRFLTDKIVDAAADVTAARVFGAGHMLPMTHAATVNELIIRHIRKTRETEAGQRRRAFFQRPSAAA